MIILSVCNLTRSVLFKTFVYGQREFISTGAGGWVSEGEWSAEQTNNINIFGALELVNMVTWSTRGLRPGLLIRN